MWSCVDFGSLARAPNRVAEVRRSDWKFTPEVLLPAPRSSRTTSPALSTRFRKFPGRVGTPLRLEGNSQQSERSSKRSGSFSGICAPGRLRGSVKALVLQALSTEKVVAGRTGSHRKTPRPLGRRKEMSMLTQLLSLALLHFVRQGTFIAILLAIGLFGASAACGWPKRLYRSPGTTRIETGIGQWSRRSPRH
jgi:hypothetical protein